MVTPPVGEPADELDGRRRREQRVTERGVLGRVAHPEHIQQGVKLAADGCDVRGLGERSGVGEQPQRWAGQAGPGELAGQARRVEGHVVPGEDDAAGVVAVQVRADDVGELGEAGLVVQVGRGQPVDVGGADACSAGVDQPRAADDDLAAADAEQGDGHDAHIANQAGRLGVDDDRLEPGPQRLAGGLLLAGGWHVSRRCRG